MGDAGVVGGGLVVATALVGFGWANPVEVWATPGAQIYVDGRLVRTVAGVSGVDEMTPLKWIEPREVKLWLTWEPHDIVVKKKWHRVKGLATEEVKRVEWPPREPMRVLARPMIQIRSDTVLTELERKAWGLQEEVPAGAGGTQGGAATLADSGQMRTLARAWSAALRNQFIDGTASPFPQNELRVEAWVREGRRGVLAYGIYNLEGKRLVGFTPIEVTDVGNAKDWSDTLATVLSALEKELDIEGLDEKVKAEGEPCLKVEAPNAAIGSKQILEDLTAETKAGTISTGVSGQQASALSTATATTAAESEEVKAEVVGGMLDIARRASGNPALASAALEAARQVNEGIGKAEKEKLEEQIKTVGKEVPTDKVTVAVVISEEAQRETAEKIVSELTVVGTPAEIRSVEGADYAHPETSVNYFVRTQGTAEASARAVEALDAVGESRGVTVGREQSAAANDLASEIVSDRVEVRLGRDVK